MRKLFCTLIFIFIMFVYVKGQNVQVIWQNQEYVKVDNSETFDYLDKKYDLTGSIKIATIKSTGTNTKNSTLNSIFYSFRETAYKLGANAFAIDNYYLSKAKDTVSITLEIYHLTKDNLEKNLRQYPLNMIYVIGDLDRNHTDGKSFKLNSNKILLLPLEFVSYQNKVGNEATISKGGFTGAKVWVKGRELRLPAFYSLKGIGIGPGANPYNQVGVTISTGNIHPVDLGLGEFLIHILNERKYTSN